jgi:hypothetical protein
MKWFDVDPPWEAVVRVEKKISPATMVHCSVISRVARAKNVPYVSGFGDTRCASAQNVSSTQFALS